MKKILLLFWVWRDSKCGIRGNSNSSVEAVVPKGAVAVVTTSALVAVMSKVVVMII